MTRINEAEFVHTLTPLFQDLNFDDLTKLFHEYQEICETSKEELVCSHSRENKFKRTIFVRPKQKLFYICLNKDIDYINRNLESIRLNKQLREVLGNFERIGFVRERGGYKVCTPMIRVDLDKRPAMQVCGKLSGIVERAGITAEESKRLIDKEMQYRKDYNECDGTPTIEYHGYYQGVHRDKDSDIKTRCEKFLEISELLDRDLHTVTHTTDPRTQNVYNLTDSQKYQILDQVASSLFTLHDDGLVHGDLKVENIYVRITEAKRIIAKVGDFGHVAELHNLHSSESSGTEKLWSPEHIRLYMRKYPSMIGCAADIWAFGWIIVHLFNLTPPEWYIKQIILLEEPSESNYTKYEDSLEKYKKIPFPKEGTLPEQLLWHCWRPEPAERAKADELVEMLRAQCGTAPSHDLSFA